MKIFPVCQQQNMAPQNLSDNLIMMNPIEDILIFGIHIKLLLRDDILL